MTLPDASAYWRTASDDGWLRQYWDSYQDAHRDFWLAAIESLAPFHSLVEIGCHVGPNLRRLKAAFPDAALTGVDPCAAAVAFGQAQPELVGVTWAATEVGPWLSAQPDRAFDIVASCYALSYVQPPDLIGVLRDCWRLTKKALVIFEPMAFDEKTGGWINGGYVEWHHPYLWALAHVPECRGLAADVTGYESAKHRLNGLVVVKRT